METAEAAFGQQSKDDEPMQGGFMNLVAVIDLQSRYIVGWSLLNTMDASWVVDCLKETLQTHGTPEIINSDQGTQFTGHQYIECFFRSIKYEKLNLHEPKDGKELFVLCKIYISFYNDQRGHSSIGDVPQSRVYRPAA